MVRCCKYIGSPKKKNESNVGPLFLILPFAILSEGFPALFTEKYADFIEANRTEDSVERLKELKRLVSEKSNMSCV